MISILKKTKSEAGAAQLVENVIVLPVVFAVIIIVIYLGQMQYQKALIVSVAERSLIWLEQAAADYNYQKIAELDFSNGASDISGVDTSPLTENVKREPYRYVAGIFTGNDYTDTEKYIKQYIENKQIFPMGDINVDIEEKSGLYKSITVTIEQKLEMPEILPWLDMPTAYDYKYSAVVYVVQPTEMIRNTDFAYELVEPYVSLVSDKLKEVVDKLNKIVQKIGILNKK